ncbi:acylphosphatase [Wenzhouxiangella sp. XN79A]|uniref:acylphosphatase n=1 Tax=Wenzhouxiangella sp. XN79A TaxID=2724193 RepID=UPI00144A5753|nr:acylphosphatase [Wenzhouxiangella sp. XN79A]
MSCARFRVTGRVQGVFFRASTQRVAKRLGLTGHAINLDDGSVEVLACGAADALDDLHDWLQRGSPTARVDRVDREAVSAADQNPPADFTTG